MSDQGADHGAGSAVRERSREAVTALLTFAILVFYSVTIGWRGVLLIADGRLVPVLLGIGVILIPLVACIAIWRLIVFVHHGQAMMRHLRSGAEPEARDVEWRGHLAVAEEHRQRRDRAAEQAAYRQAVRAWRASRTAEPPRG